MPLRSGAGPRGGWATAGAGSDAASLAPPASAICRHTCQKRRAGMSRGWKTWGKRGGAGGADRMSGKSDRRFVPSALWPSGRPPAADLPCERALADNLTCGGPDMGKTRRNGAERPDVVPARFHHRHVRPRYACHRCEDRPLQAGRAGWLIGRGVWAEGTLAHVTVSGLQHRGFGCPADPAPGASRSNPAKIQKKPTAITAGSMQVFLGVTS